VADRHPGRVDPIGLYGRGRERGLLDEVIASVCAGESRTLVLRGEAGVGKTALLNYVVESAPGVRVLRASGVESEMELAFASVHQLCGPLLARVPELPVPQRHALEIAFGLREGPAPDRFLVGLALLTLLSQAADERPLLCVVDDAQWLDEVSAGTLAFVARRLLAEPVGFVLAARADGPEFRGLAELAVDGLRNGDARALLRSVVPFRLDDRILARIVAETRGNPLALLELPRGLTITQLADGFGPLDAEVLPARLEQSFERRLAAVPDPVRLFMLIAAAEPTGDPLLVWRAAELLGIDHAAIDADNNGLVTIRDSVLFRHPLVRSAIYRSAAVNQRRKVHLALAEATDRDIDRDRRAWHLAVAAAGPDEEVATELEQSAARAQARGGVAATAAILQRAVALTQHPTRRADRALRAADVSLQAGAFDAALRLAATAESGASDDLRRARIDLVRGQVTFALGNAVDAAPMLLQAARELEPFDQELSRQTLMTAWGAAFVAAQVIGEGVVSELGHAVRALPRRLGDPRPIDTLLDGYALLQTEGHAAAASTLKRAAEVLMSIPAEDVLHWGRLVTGASTAVWDEVRYRATCVRQVQIVREAGALAQLPVHLNQLALACAWIGDLAGAASFVAEIDSVTLATGGRVLPHAMLALRALQGSEEQFASAVKRTVEDSRQTTGVPTAAHWAAAILFNGLGRYDEAAASAQLATANTLNPWFSMWALPELVEAASRTGQLGIARDALDRLSETTQPSGTDFALGLEGRCRAMLSAGTAADALYQEAIERLSRTQLRPELARTQLLFGEWLRRQGRRVAARDHLRAAHDAFIAIGMEAFGERARRELIATGETVRRRTSTTRDDLTPQEEQIARLARDGLSNPEIGAQLFLSARTVEWHLHKVFSKLGISSRRQLRKALPDIPVRRPG
jgi:DNA-binding CsgD family transcriptional regulator/tetratricopeptide (TPR) repeat protein